MMSYSTNQAGGQSAVPAYYRRGWGGPRNRFARPFPAVNIAEAADHYTLKLVAPGRNKESFHVSVVDNRLVITSQPEILPETTNAQYRLFEFQIVPFKRSFALSDKVEPAGITAKYENGILLVHVPKKAEEPKTPALQIQVA